MDIYLNLEEIRPWNVDLDIFSELMLMEVLGGDNILRGEGLEFEEKNTPNKIN